MPTYLLTWNPEKWRWKHLHESLAQINQKGYCEETWSVGVTKKIHTGDRVFLMKLGIKPRGIFASGWVASDTFEDTHWGDKTKTALYVDVHFDTIIDLEQEEIFSIDNLQKGIYEGVNWTPQASGMSISENVAERLEKDWANFLNREIPVQQIVYPDEIDSAISFYEGAPKQVTVNVYERNPEARAICIQRYGAICSVCNLDFGKRYGEIGKGFIHVHHLKPVSIRKGYELSPINDLRPVCPNCHAMLHKRKPEPYTIDELKFLLKTNAV
ncbi:HNH endonuclease [bacterium]|jgi:5-methylcytosine-specific restriction protein A|nr:HNH endonuclease [bacterium]